MRVRIPSPAPTVVGALQSGGTSKGHGTAGVNNQAVNALLTPNGGRGGIGVGAIAFDCKASGQAGFGVGDVASTMRGMGHTNSHQNGGGHQAAMVGIGVGAIAFANTAGATNLGISETGEAPPITTRNGDPGNVMLGVKVRRLTPRECERLQGFPDDYTLIPMRGKPAADGPRYKSLGNSMATPVVRWIGERIAAVHSIP